MLYQTSQCSEGFIASIRLQRGVFFCTRTELHCLFVLTCTDMNRWLFEANIVWHWCWAELNYPWVCTRVGQAKMLPQNSLPTPPKSSPSPTLVVKSLLEILFFYLQNSTKLKCTIYFLAVWFDVRMIFSCVFLMKAFLLGKFPNSAHWYHQHTSKRFYE